MILILGINIIITNVYMYNIYVHICTYTHRFSIRVKFDIDYWCFDKYTLLDI